MNSMLENAEAIIFDLDGTLWDSSHQIVHVWNKVFKRHPGLREPATEEEVASLMGKTPEEIAVRILPNEPQERAFQIMDECSREECLYLTEHGGKLYADVRSVLVKLKQTHKLYIVSNCQSGYVQAFLTHHELWDLFEDFEMSGRTGLPKADNIRLVMRRNQISSAVYVGDTSGDETAARAAGIPFIYAAYGFGTAHQPDDVIHSLRDLI